MVKWLLAAALLVFPGRHTISACSVCFAAGDDPITRATTLGIIVMLVVVALVLTAVAAFALSLRRRATELSKRPC